MGYERMSHHIVKGCARRNPRRRAITLGAAILAVMASSAVLLARHASAISINSDIFYPIGNTSLAGIIGRIIQGLIGISGVIALAMFVYGGVMWMTSAGNKDRVDKAKKTIVWSILGLVMIFGAYAMVSFVFSALGQS